MAARRKRQMVWQNGEWIDKHFITPFNSDIHLLFGAILLTQEAGALLDFLLIHLGTR